MERSGAGKCPLDVAMGILLRALGCTPQSGRVQVALWPLGATAW